MNSIIVSPYDAAQDPHYQQRFITCHAPILVKELVQPTDDLRALYDLAHKLKPQFEATVQSYAKRIGCGFEIAEIKPFESALSKSLRKGSAAAVFDFLRASLHLRTPNQISETARITSPGTNSEIGTLENSFARPNIDTGMRRLQSVIRISDGTDFMYAEIQGRHAKFEAALDKTHRIHEAQRNLRTSLQMEKILVDMASTKKIRARIEKLDLKRLSIHAGAAIAHGLDRMEEQRVFFAVNRDGETIPAFATYRSFDGAFSVIRPDAESGCFVIDNSLIHHVRPIISKKDGSLRFELRDCIDTSNDRTRFIQASEAIASGAPPYIIAGFYGQHTADIMPFPSRALG